MRIVVCGGRSFKDYRRLCRVLEKLNEQKIYLLSHGNALGADTLAGLWGLCNGIMVVEHEADWDKWRSAAGPIRNQEMLDSVLPDAVVAFPGGAGTADCVRRAKKLKIRIIQG